MPGRYTYLALSCSGAGPAASHVVSGGVLGLSVPGSYIYLAVSCPGAGPAASHVVSGGVLGLSVCLGVTFTWRCLVQVLGLLAAALEAGSDALVGHLLAECDLPGWLASAPLWVTPLPREGDPRCVSSINSHSLFNETRGCRCKGWSNLAGFC